jgi:hypothetical protein
MGGDLRGRAGSGLQHREWGHLPLELALAEDRGRLRDRVGPFYPGHPSPLEPQLAEAGPVWAEIAAKHGLAEPDLTRLASAWHTDMDLGREMEVVTDMTRSRLAGFRDYQPTPGSFLDLFARLRKERIIPD